MTFPVPALHNVSLRIRMLAIFVVGLWSAQLMYLFLESSVSWARYQSLMNQRAIEVFIHQVDALRSDPNVSLPVKASPPVSRRSKVWTSETSAFEETPIERNPRLEARYQTLLRDQGVEVETLRAASFTPPSSEELRLVRERFVGSRPLPTETLIALRMEGYPLWVNAQIASYPAPRPISLMHILISLGVFALVGGAGVALVTRQIKNSLSDLRQAAADVGKPGYGRPTPVKGPLEFRDAIQALNDSRQSVSELLEQKTVMLGAISHELRTPLTSLRLRLEGRMTEEDRARAIASVEDMTRLLDDIIDLARGSHWEQTTTRYDLTSVLADVVEDERERGREVSFQCNERLVAKIRPSSIRRLLHNLVGNAAVYAGAARVSAARNGETIRIVVEDDGPGIPPDEIEDVFLPFTRGEVSRRIGNSGVGIGLTIARLIARAHGGDLSISNKAPTGLHAEITLPA